MSVRHFSPRAFTFAALVFSLASFAAVPRVAADPLLIRTGSDHASFSGYGGPVWQTMTGYINQGTAGDVTVVTSLTDLAEMMRFPALWVDTDEGFTGQGLSTTELNNIASFAATGRRVVLWGENEANWQQWDQQLLSVVGGTTPTDVFDMAEGFSYPVLVHPLTAGVQSTFSMGDGLAIGGTPLFTQNYATLWGTRQNVLTVLSVDIVADYNFTSTPGNQRFGRNIVMWATNSKVSNPVPEPSTLLLIGTAVAATMSRRRRRGQSAEAVE